MSALNELVELFWELTDDSAENAQTGELTMELTKAQASKMYHLFWRIGGTYRLGLEEHGWTPRRRKS